MSELRIAGGTYYLRHRSPVARTTPDAPRETWRPLEAGRQRSCRQVDRAEDICVLRVSVEDGKGRGRQHGRTSEER